MWCETLKDKRIESVFSKRNGVDIKVQGVSVVNNVSMKACWIVFTQFVGIWSDIIVVERLFNELVNLVFEATSFGFLDERLFEESHSPFMEENTIDIDTVIPEILNRMWIRKVKSFSTCLLILFVGLRDFFPFVFSRFCFLLLAGRI